MLPSFRLSKSRPLLRAHESCHGTGATVRRHRDRMLPASLRVRVRARAHARVRVRGHAWARAHTTCRRSGAASAFVDTAAALAPSQPPVSPVPVGLPLLVTQQDASMRASARMSISIFTQMFAHMSVRVAWVPESARQCAAVPAGLECQTLTVQGLHTELRHIGHHDKHVC